MSDRCPCCSQLIMPNWRWSGRVRRDQRRFLYAVRRNLCLDRNFVIAENYRRFWRPHPWKVLEWTAVQNWTGER